MQPEAVLEVPREGEEKEQRAHGFDEEDILVLFVSMPLAYASPSIAKAYRYFRESRKR